MEKNKLDINLVQKLDYKFKNIELLKEALIHPSFNLGADKDAKSYERFEFLGDAVLMLVITELLVQEFLLEAEGDLAKRRSFLISRDMLFYVAQKLDLSQHILMSNDEYKFGGRNNPNILEDVLEAILGAMYLDGGLEACKKFISEHWLSLIRSQAIPPMEVKSELQEWSQEYGKGIPKYTLCNKEGEDHKPVFTIKVTLPGMPSFLGKGESKKIAEKSAAQMMLEYIKANNGK